MSTVHVGSLAEQLLWMCRQRQGDRVWWLYSSGQTVLVPSAEHPSETGRRHKRLIPFWMACDAELLFSYPLHVPFL